MSVNLGMSDIYMQSIFFNIYFNHEPNAILDGGGSFYKFIKPFSCR